MREDLEDYLLQLNENEFLDFVAILATGLSVTQYLHTEGVAEMHVDIGFLHELSGLIAKI